MRHGHVTGTKRETQGASDWYAHIEAANIQAADDQARALTTALATQVGAAVTALPEAASRIAKAASIVQRKDVWPMSDGTWLVGSQTDTEHAYLVRRGPWQCECAHAAYRESVCSHVLAVQLTVKVGAAYTPSYN